MEIQKAERCYDCCLFYVFRVDRDLMVSYYQVNLRKGAVTGKAVGVVLYVLDWIPVRNGPRVKGSIVSTGPPTAVPFRHEMEGGRPRALGAFGCAVPQHGVELGLVDG
jgi:hypothetical protein